MQQLILVDEKDMQVGTIEKMAAHQLGLLHRAFSVFIFNNHGDMLIQQRAISKYHSGGLWTNACCSHPYEGQETKAAAEKRLQEEMGFTVSLDKVFDFVYRASFDNGLTEYEFDHVFVGNYSGEILPDKAEVQDFCFMKMDEIRSSMLTHPQKYTEWFKIAFPKLEDYLSKKA